MNVLMSPNHPDWKAFKRLLKGRLLARCCQGYLWEAPAILRQLPGRFPNIDILGTMDFFKKNGAHCDCEVLLNIELLPAFV